MMMAIQDMVRMVDQAVVHQDTLCQVPILSMGRPVVQMEEMAFLRIVVGAVQGRE